MSLSQDPAVDGWPMNKPHLELDPCGGGRENVRSFVADSFVGLLPLCTQGNVSHLRRKVIGGIWHCFILCGWALVSVVPSLAGEIISQTNEFQIERDFSLVVINESAAKSACVFVDTDRFVVRGLPPAKNSELQQTVISALGTKTQVVRSKGEANYLVQIRMEQFSDYSIRNPQGNYSRGIVMFSICGFPIKEIARDCENLNYFYFREYRTEEVFHTVLQMWLERTFRAG